MDKNAGTYKMIEAKCECGAEFDISGPVHLGGMYTCQCGKQYKMQYDGEYLRFEPIRQMAVLEMDMPANCKECKIVVGGLMYNHCPYFVHTANTSGCPPTGRRDDCPLKLVDNYKSKLVGPFTKEQSKETLEFLNVKTKDPYEKCLTCKHDSKNHHYCDNPRISPENQCIKNSLWEPNEDSDRPAGVSAGMMAGEVKAGYTGANSIIGIGYEDWRDIYIPVECKNKGLKYSLEGDVGNEFIVYGNDTESVYIGSVMSHDHAVKMIDKLNGKQPEP